MFIVNWSKDFVVFQKIRSNGKIIDSYLSYSPKTFYPLSSYINDTMLHLLVVNIDNKINRFIEYCERN